VRPATEEAIQARDRAILERLRVGPATLDQLVEVMPIEAGQTMDIRIDECARAVRRLGFKKVVRATVNGWALT
jgi:hypothetical protein